jgi:hypothetical protein
MRSRNLPLDCAGLSRALRLRLWLRGHGLSLGILARRMGVHKSAPGKWLVSCTDTLPAGRREELLGLGVPAELLPDQADAGGSWSSSQ